MFVYLLTKAGIVSSIYISKRSEHKIWKHKCSIISTVLWKSHQEIDKLKTIFEKNGYPKSVVYVCIKKYLDKVFIKEEVVLKASKRELICVLPFIGNKSLQLRTHLDNSIENNLKFCKLKVIFQSPCKLSLLFCYKDFVKKDIRSDTVYKYTCSNVFIRVAEHMGISNLTGKCLKCVKQSAVSYHLLECNCSTDFDHFNILPSDANKFRLLIEESLLIKRDQPQLNKTVKSFPLILFDWNISW